MRLVENVAKLSTAQNPVRRWDVYDHLCFSFLFPPSFGEEQGAQREELNVSLPTIIASWYRQKHEAR